MKGIIQIKEVPHGKPSFSIVKCNGHKGKTGGRLPEKAGAAHDKLGAFVLPEQVQKRYGQNAHIAVIRMDGITQKSSGANAKQDAQRAQHKVPYPFFQTLNAPEHQHSDQQGKKHILPLHAYGFPVKSQVKGHL